MYTYVCVTKSVDTSIMSLCLIPLHRPRTDRYTHTCVYIYTTRNSEGDSPRCAQCGTLRSGFVSDDVEILDLETNTWSVPYIAGDAHEARPGPRNTHSATLVGDRILVVAGGTGDGTNSGPPRGGREALSGWCLMYSTLATAATTATIALYSTRSTSSTGSAISPKVPIPTICTSPTVLTTFV